MSSGLPVVAIFGALDIVLRSDDGCRETETTEMECRCYATDEELHSILARDRPSVIISLGNVEDYPKLMRAPFEVRRRWLHFPRGADPKEMGRRAYSTFITDIAVPREAPPLITVFTAAFKTGDRIFRPFRSLLSQTYPEWEWIILDDSDDNGETFSQLSALARQDGRIYVFRAHRHSGRIGEVKRQAAMMGRGSILVELDHDDELTHTCLSDLVSAFGHYPEAGFAYSDCAEVFEDGRNAVYPDGWGFGYGITTPIEYRGRNLLAHRAPCANPKTIRHIVSAPNHVRAWRRSTYESLGGHSPLLATADDYELCVRTFLATRMIQVRTLGYIQYYNTTGNTQVLRNKDIQRAVRSVQYAYDLRIHQRFEELGIDDYLWDGTLGHCVWSRPAPENEQHACLIWPIPPA